MERWVVIEGFENYEVSSLGRVRRRFGCNGTQAGRILKPKVNSQGYESVGLRRSGRSCERRVNRLVCWAFHGPPSPHRSFACHRNDQPSDNRAENLYWGSRKDNASDAIRNDRYLRGENCGSSRHSETTVRSFLADASRSLEPVSRIAARHGISKSQGHKILHGQYWKHLQ